MSQYFKVKIYDRYLVGLGPREVSVVRLEEGESSVTEVTLKQCSIAALSTVISERILRCGGDNLLQIPFLR